MEILNNRIDLFVDHCDKTLPLNNAKLSPSFFYSSLIFCVTDAIFSIGIRYSITKNVVQHLCDFLKTPQYRPYGENFPEINKQISILDTIKHFADSNYYDLATKVFKSTHRTSSGNGILKAEAVCLVLQLLQRYQVNYFQDIKNLIINEEFINDYKAITGQRSGISIYYLFMLAGNDDLIKPDRMVFRFCENVFGKGLIQSEVVDLIQKSASILKTKYPQITARLLDHEIWKYQKEKKDK